MMNKIPIKLLWSLLCKIFEDLDVNKLQLSSFDTLEVKPNNCYELLYGLILKLLDSTVNLHKHQVSGISTNIENQNIDKTIANNTLRNCEVYSTTWKYCWDCAEHNIFLKALSICKENASDSFLNQKVIKDFVSQLKLTKGITSLDCSITIDSALNILVNEFDEISSELVEDSLMNRESNTYTNLCRFSSLVLRSQAQQTDLIGLKNINYNRLDNYIIQQYGVREVWNVINRQSELNGKKHREFQSKILVSDNCSALEPDAVYIFDDSKHKDIILDVKLYGASCLDANDRHRFSANVNQVCTYKYMFPQYIAKHKNKSSRKNITPDDVNAWLLYFRKNITESEKEFNGTHLDVGNIGVYTINMFSDCTVKDLDKQIEEFVLKYLL